MKQIARRNFMKLGAVAALFGFGGKAVAKEKTLRGQINETSTPEELHTALIEIEDYHYQFSYANPLEKVVVGGRILFRDSVPDGYGGYHCSECKLIIEKDGFVLYAQPDFWETGSFVRVLFPKTEVKLVGNGRIFEPSLNEFKLFLNDLNTGRL